MQTEARNVVGETEPLIGIGPVISGAEGGTPIYYIDLLLRNGELQRMTWARAGRAFDRVAKNDAYRIRILLANQHRPNVVLTHDQTSFEGLVLLMQDAVQRRPGGRSGRQREGAYLAAA
jgi:hypothetical protein